MRSWIRCSKPTTPTIPTFSPKLLRQSSEQPLRQRSSLETNTFKPPWRIAKNSEKVFGVTYHLRLTLELYLPWLDAQWTAGQRNGSELWRRLKSQGFRGCLRVVSEWAGRRRRAETADAEALARAPSARTIARLMTICRDNLSKSETATIAAIERGTPSLLEAREIIAAFQAMVRKKSLIDLDPWMERARQSLVRSFANGVAKDRAAVAAAITSAWSNGQTEGQITKLKLVKRQMYGRGKIDLLQARIIGCH